MLLGEALSVLELVQEGGTIVRLQPWLFDIHCHVCLNCSSQWLNMMAVLRQICLWEMENSVMSDFSLNNPHWPCHTLLGLESR